ncbi:serine hydrolase domain-containing protein [Massilia agri]|uniref:Beta-lactamase family protein n=1 Tax=Massilia agri TaxID=1886785 RepID=A0ABT2AHI9_9BURK|nr:beta-lactamase family protein [Massilia agri]
MTKYSKLWKSPIRLLCRLSQGAAFTASLYFAAANAVMAQHASSPVTMTSDDLSTLFDEHAHREMKQADIAGAAIVVVKDGTLLFARGYGYADIENKVPISPIRTLFRIASVSKVITYTAVMQLVERGKIDLDADIARYVDFPIPARFGKPITMRHLMSHTAGFDDTVQGRWVKAGDLGPLRDYLVRHMPARLYAPGTVPAYSSYSTTLAGYIVERVSGEPFNTYIENHVFKPLEMDYSSFAQPLPSHLAPLLAKGYRTASDGPSPFAIAQAAPATSMSSSAMDMARFMLAHLGADTASAKPLLKSTTLAAMHSIQFRHHPAGPGIALGTFEMDSAGPRVIGHTGDIPNYYSGMYLFPQQRVGLFIVQNSEAGGDMRNKLLRVFAARYFAHPAQVAPPLQIVAAEGPDELSGSYRRSWRFDRSPLSLKSLLVEQTVVRSVGRGNLVVDSYVGPNGIPVAWRQIEAGVWQSLGDPLQRLYFKKNAEGEWELSGNGGPPSIRQKSPWYRHQLFMRVILISSLVILLLSSPWQLLSALFRSRPQGRGVVASRALRRNLFVGATGFVVLAPWIVCGGVTLAIANDLLFVSSPACGVLLRLAQILACAGAVATFSTLWMTGVRLRMSGGSWAGRMHHAVLCLACVGATVMAWQGGLLFWDGRF